MAEQPERVERWSETPAVFLRTARGPGTADALQLKPLKN